METKTAQHTPGDWKHVGEPGGCRYIMAGDVQLAWVNSTADGIDNEARAAETMANGDLFAAAPDMLDILRDVLWKLEHFDEFETPERNAFVRNAPIHIRAAIAKAEGKT